MWHSNDSADCDMWAWETMLKLVLLVTWIVTFLPTKGEFSSCRAVRSIVWPWQMAHSSRYVHKRRNVWLSIIGKVTCHPFYVGYYHKGNGMGLVRIESKALISLASCSPPVHRKSTVGPRDSVRAISIHRRCMIQWRSWSVVSSILLYLYVPDRTRDQFRGSTDSLTTMK